MQRRVNPYIDDEIKRLKERLQCYLDREKEMLDKSGVKSYTIGSRSRTGYDTALGDIQKIINELQEKIKELELQKFGIKPRRAVGVVSRDW